MSYTVFDNEIFEDTNLSTTEKLYLITLIRFYNTKLDYAYPSITGLMKAVNTKNRNQVINVLKRLEEKGYIKKEVQSGRNNNRYFILKYLIGNKIDTSNKIDTNTSNKLDTNTSNKLDTQQELRTIIKTTTNDNSSYLIPSKDNKNLTSIISEYTDDNNLRRTIIDFIDMRNNLKKPITNSALSIILRDLNTYATTNAVKIEILEKSILNNWKIIYPLNDNYKNKDSEPLQQLTNEEKLNNLLKSQGMAI